MTRLKNSFCDRVIIKLGCEVGMSSSILIVICIIIFVRINLSLGSFEVSILFPYTEFLDRSAIFAVTIGIMTIIFLSVLPLIGTIFHFIKSLKVAKILWIISLILSSFIFISLTGFTIYLIFSNRVNSVFEYNYCPNSQSLILVEMYDKIDAFGKLNTCPAYCNSEDHSTKLYDCGDYKQAFGLTSYSKKDFDLLDQLEDKYSCAGLCSNHSNVFCTFFHNMGVETHKSCQVELKALALKGYYTFSILFIVLIIGIGRHISALIDAIFNNENIEGSEFYLEKEKNQVQGFSIPGEVKLSNYNRENYNRNIVNLDGSPEINSNHQNIDKMLSPINMLVINQAKGEGNDIKEGNNNNYAINEKKI